MKKIVTLSAVAFLSTALYANTDMQAQIDELNAKIAKMEKLQKKQNQKNRHSTKPLKTILTICHGFLTHLQVVVRYL